MLTKVSRTHGPRSSRHLRHRLAGFTALAVATLPVAACGSGTSSAGAKASSQISSAISSGVSQAGSAASEALSSASSAASSALGQIADGVTATSDVSAGSVTTGSDGHAASQLTVANPTADAHDYTISVTFEDSSGAAQDVAVVSVSQVPAHGSATATARSNRNLSGTLTAKVTAAVRH